MIKLGNSKMKDLMIWRRNYTFNPPDFHRIRKLFTENQQEPPSLHLVQAIRKNLLHQTARSISWKQIVELSVKDQLLGENSFQSDDDGTTSDVASREGRSSFHLP